MKKLLHKICSFFWIWPYVKFTKQKNNIKISVYWGRLDCVDDKFLSAIEAIYIHPQIQNILRQAILKFGNKVNDLTFAFYFINRLDGLDHESALEFAEARMINETPVNRLQNQTKDEDDEKEPKGNEGVIDPLIFVEYHQMKGNL